MFDLIGKRRYGYVLSGILTVLSLVFILLTLVPQADLGLRFSIAYTGGTVWEVHFEGDTPSPAEVRAVLDEHGLPGSEVAITGADGRDYVLIRTEALTLIETDGADGAAAPLPSGSPGPGVPRASVSPLGSDAPSTSPAPTLDSPSTSPAPTLDSAAEPGPTALVAATASPTAVPSPDPVPSAASLATPTAAAAPTPADSPTPSVTAAAAPTDAAAPTAAAAPAAAASPAAASPVVPAASPPADASPGPSVAPAAGTEGPDDPVAGVPTEGRFGELAAALQERFGRIDEVRQQNSVGPVVSNELVQQTFLLILFAAVAIMTWITYRFRDLRMGVTAIVALLHDVIVTVGAFAILGTFFDLQVDALFVTAMLTVIGFSVHDTIVVFDRVRENRQRHLGEPILRIVDFSLMQTIGRSITTSLTLVVTLSALMLLGSEAIRAFSFALLIGVMAGTYSSIFVATPLFVDWYLRDERRKDRQVQPSPA